VFVGVKVIVPNFKLVCDGKQASSFAKKNNKYAHFVTPNGHISQPQHEFSFE
jgi:hypothetical protein